MKRYHLLLTGACLLRLAFACEAQVVPPTVPAKTAPAAAPVAGPVVPAPESKDAQDLVFFGDTRPLLFRLHVLVNGRPFPSAWDDFVIKLFDWYDLDGDGVLTKKETQRIMRSQDLVNLLSGAFDYFNYQANFARPEEIDTNKDGKITREELGAYYRKAGTGALQASLNLGGGGTSGKLTTTLFRLLDTNKDGKLSRDELAAAPQALRKLDVDDDEMISAEELLPARNNVYYSLIGGANMAGGLPDNAAFMLLVPGSPLAKLTQQLLNRYDKDQKQKLSRAEIGLDKEAFDQLDANHDGQLDTTELTKWLSRPPDLELLAQFGAPPSTRTTPSLFDPFVELSKLLSKKAPVDVFNPTGRKMPLASAARREGEGLLMTLSDAQLDLRRGNGNGMNNSAGVKQFYLQQFKQSDTDKKGYLVRKQFDQPQLQFLRGLFNLADRDGDDKLYEKELSGFLDMQALGAGAHTSLQISDHGRGLFELLDANGDGRLSVRELRTAWSRLSAWDRNGDGLLAETEVPRQFEITLSQGQLNYPYRSLSIGGYNQRVRNQPAPRGPLWFRKMDRNNDGDVSFREWLGSEEEFRRLDTDGDGLISMEEAERAETLLKKDKTVQR